MSNAYLWVKALHIIFVASWFAGLFYLPRLFVNLAMVPSDSHAERERLLLMARKLYRFSSLLMVPALTFGLVLWLYFGMGKGGGQIWLHLKLILVIGVVGYHHVCRRILRDFESLANRRSHRWFRVFNEVSVLLFATIVCLVVLKPVIS
ncbi:membrane protein [Aquabacterium sp. NJ1]|uniref:CopD family protein n=1 Tax=Aquabacterium sp. NJ1 TaxID=1538295 RepID=UPI00052C47ED|nr:CopD family protein [Aquabacterium sp. NJ1]KGM40680.1 membrane protein [Aquabacterium sp. NJ1]